MNNITLAVGALALVAGTYVIAQPTSASKAPTLIVQKEAATAASLAAKGWAELFTPSNDDPMVVKRVLKRGDKVAFLLEGGKVLYIGSGDAAK
jgi:hypothetical protein